MGFLLDTIKQIILENTRYEILMQKFTEPKKKGKEALMDKQTLMAFMKADPTTRQTDEEINKVGAYSQWIIKQYMGLQQGCDQAHGYDPKPNSPWTQCLVEKRRLFMEDLYKVTEDLLKFDYLKKTTKYTGEKDINKFQSTEQLYDAIKDFDISKEELTTTKAERVRDDVEVVHEDADWIVMVPKTKEASCHYGGGESRWCTASKSSNYYDHYSKQGPLYMIMRKADSQKGPNESRSHQFHFESNSFMNAEDRSIDLATFFNQYPELKPFFQDKFARYLDTSFGEKIEVRYPSDTVSKYISIYGFEDFFKRIPKGLKRLDIEYNDRQYGNDKKERPGFALPDLSPYKNMEVLHVEGLLSEIPESVGQLQQLEFISVPNNPNLREIPENVANLPNLEVLNIKQTPAKVPPALEDKASRGELIIIR
tara:strand:- start:7953 stop:9224 length:1272 start_codon:yes stop_codon:yes gene_type:complete